MLGLRKEEIDNWMNSQPDGVRTELLRQLNLETWNVDKAANQQLEADLADLANALEKLNTIGSPTDPLAEDSEFRSAIRTLLANLSPPRRMCLLAWIVANGWGNSGQAILTTGKGDRAVDAICARAIEASLIQIFSRGLLAEIFSPDRLMMIQNALIDDSFNEDE